MVPGGRGPCSPTSEGAAPATSPWGPRGSPAGSAGLGDPAEAAFRPRPSGSLAGRKPREKAKRKPSGLNAHGLKGF